MATVRAVTWNTVEVSSPAILNMLGIISSRPCDAVKVLVRAPACKRAVDRAGGPRFALHFDDVGHGAENFLRPAAAQASGISPKPDEGVIG